MFRWSRAPWGRSEDRCDGAGSEADGTRPPVKPGHKMPVLGNLVFIDRKSVVSGQRVQTCALPICAPWGRSEDRCDGAGSEADGTSPPVKPGHKMPVLGNLVF